jgi:AcrR family transcriptional regulator
MTKRRRGRPPTRVLDRDAITTTALQILETAGFEALTLRAVARQLRVDAMAIYHYFPDKEALLRAAAATTYDRIDPRAGTTGRWPARLESLACAYLRVLGRSGQLLRYLSAGNDATAEAVARFEARFRVAVEPLELPPRQHRAAHHAFVDFVHGFSLSLPAGGTLPPRLRRALHDELGVLVAGMRALATART